MKEVGKPEAVAADAANKTPAITQLLENDIKPVLPYTRPKTKDGFMRNVYDEYYDCYLCPDGQVFEYVTTKEGYILKLLGGECGEIIKQTGH